MIKPWVKNAHAALHLERKKMNYIIIKGKRHPIQSSPKQNLPFIKVGDFTFIKQNPLTSSKWAHLAKEGKKVTQVLLQKKYYGVIVGKEVLRYRDRMATPEFVGRI